MPASEQDFLDQIDRHFAPHTLGGAPGVSLGRGDDCAILDVPGPLCLSTDLFVEHQHFRRSYFAPGDIGHKALAAAASDLAAMGAAPVGFALSLMLSEADATAEGDEFLDGLLSGMAALSRQLELPLIGGDLSRGPALALDITVLGRPGPSGRLLKRAQARPGDTLVVVGPVGLARAGLLALEAQGREACRRWPAATSAHLRPLPRIEAGLALAGLMAQEGSAVRGLMDLSDGLARDLPRFLSAYGCDLALKPEGLHPEAREFYARQELDPVEQAVLGGEDYALLAAVTPSGLSAVLEAIPEAFALGTVSEAPGLRLNGRPFAKAGFDHFG